MTWYDMVWYDSLYLPVVKKKKLWVCYYNTVALIYAKGKYKASDRHTPAHLYSTSWVFSEPSSRYGFTRKTLTSSHMRSSIYHRIMTSKAFVRTVPSSFYALVLQYYVLSSNRFTNRQFLIGGARLSRDVSAQSYNCNHYRGMT